MFTDLARRLLSHANTVGFVKRNVVATLNSPEGSERVEVPTWGAILLWVSFVAAVLSIAMVSYMLHEVIATLCMVESPTAAITVSPSTHEAADKEEKEGLLEAGPTITLVNQKPITSSIRGTMKHLKANAGRFSRFRGFRIHALHNMLLAFVSTFVAGVVRGVPGQHIIVAAVSGAALANIHAAWTHKVVGMPTDKSFWQRIPSKANWKILAVPAAIEAAMPYVSMYLMCGVAMLMGLHKLDQENVREYNGAQWTSLIIRLIITFVTAISCTLFLCLPAIVTLVRIEASILPEDEDTIVPFDRTFGGKVVSPLMGGTGQVRFLDAWRSFTWEARRRLIKLFVKGFFILAGLIFIVAHVLAAEIFVVMGPALGEFLSQMKAGGL